MLSMLSMKNPEFTYRLAAWLGIEPSLWNYEPHVQPLHLHAGS